MKDEHKMNLQLFAEGGGEGGAAASSGPAEAQAPAAAAAVTEPALRPAEERQMRRAGILKKAATPSAAEPDPAKPAEESAENAREGTAEAETAGGDPEGTPPERTKEERQKAFIEMMNGEYASEFKQFAEELFGRMQANSSKADEKYRPLVKALSEKYGVDASDLDGLTEAVKGPVKDDAYFQALAIERGTSVENAKAWDRDQTEMRKLKAENEKLSKVAERQRQAAAVQKIQDNWRRQAEDLKARYPEFDFAKERQNPNFSAILRAGGSLEAAYQAVHFQELAQRRVEAAAQKVEQGVVSRIERKAARPAENGISPARAGTVLKKDPSKLTTKECEELERQARLGKTITFG